MTYVRGRPTYKQHPRGPRWDRYYLSYPQPAVDPLERHCVWCGTLFTQRPGIATGGNPQVFCCYECKHAWNNWTYKPPIPPEMAYHDTRTFAKCVNCKERLPTRWPRDRCLWCIIDRRVMAAQARARRKAKSNKVVARRLAMHLLLRESPEIEG